MRISDWSSDVCSSDLRAGSGRERDAIALRARDRHAARVIERGLADLARPGKNALDLLGGEPGTVVHAVLDRPDRGVAGCSAARGALDAIGMVSQILQALGGGRIEPGNARSIRRSEEHKSELQSLMRNSNAVVCLKKKKKLSQKH